MKKILFLISVIFFSVASYTQEIHWRTFSEDVFKDAKAQHKFVLLDLKANWCHWCHVMDDSTYSNKAVIDYINEHYIPVEADQDRNPDLAKRYQDYGWPATIVFNPNRDEIVKRAGYFPPDDFLRLLYSIVKDPSPETNESKLSQLTVSKNDNVDLERQKSILYGALDFDLGGYNYLSHKYVAFEPFEYAINRYTTDSQLKKWLDASMQGGFDLEDKSWGGIYQYSTDYDWKHLHFEKLLKIQTRYIDMFLSYYGLTKNEQALTTALNIEKYVQRFLKNPNGKGYFNAQDADLVQGVHAGHYFSLSDAERMKLGIPVVDSNVYTNNNAKLATSFFLLFATTSDSSFYKKATSLLDFLENDRKRKEGGYQHGAVASNIVTLEDNLPMAEAFITAFQVTQDKKYLSELDKLLQFITSNFALENGSYQSYVGNLALKGEPIIEENAALARTLNLASYMLHNPQYKTTASKIGTFLYSDQIFGEINYPEAELLTLAYELATTPISFAQLIVNQDDEATKIRMKAITNPKYYKLVQRFEKDAIPADKKIYFDGFNKNVMLMCNDTYCSSPIYTLADFK